MGQIPPALRQEIRLLAQGKADWPLVVVGKPGTGKTCAGLCLLDYAGGLYFTANALCEAVLASQARSLWSAGPNPVPISPDAFWRELGASALIVLDELGTRERVSDFHRDQVQKLLDWREGKPLLCLSNLTVERLAAVYDDRVASRLAAGSVVHIEGVDRRIAR